MGVGDFEGIEFRNAWGTSITLTSVADLQAVEFTNASGTSITLTGVADLQGVEFTNASGTSLTLTGLADLQGVEFTNASGTNLSVTGDLHPHSLSHRLCRESGHRHHRPFHHPPRDRQRFHLPWSYGGRNRRLAGRGVYECLRDVSYFDRRG